LHLVHVSPQFDRAGRTSTTYCHQRDVVGFHALKHAVIGKAGCGESGRHVVMAQVADAKLSPPAAADAVECVFCENRDISDDVWKSEFSIADRTDDPPIVTFPIAKTRMPRNKGHAVEGSGGAFEHGGRIENSVGPLGVEAQETVTGDFVAAKMKDASTRDWRPVQVNHLDHSLFEIVQNIQLA
jgi:hypothetical protein